MPAIQATSDGGGPHCSVCVADIKANVLEVRFWCGEDLYYPTCHDGLSPLAGVHHEKYYMLQVEENERDLQDATTVMYGDRKSARSKPILTPTEFWSFLHMLGNHVKIVGTATTPTLERLPRFGGYWRASVWTRTHTPQRCSPISSGTS